MHFELTQSPRDRTQYRFVHGLLDCIAEVFVKLFWTGPRVFSLGLWTPAMFQRDERLPKDTPSIFRREIDVKIDIAGEHQIKFICFVDL